MFWNSSTQESVCVCVCVCVCERETRRWNDCNGGTQEGVDGIFKQIIDQFHTHPPLQHTHFSLLFSLSHTQSVGNHEWQSNTAPPRKPPIGPARTQYYNNNICLYQKETHTYTCAYSLVKKITCIQANLDAHMVWMRCASPLKVCVSGNAAIGRWSGCHGEQWAQKTSVSLCLNKCVRECVHECLNR